MQILNSICEICIDCYCFISILNQEATKRVDITIDMQNIFRYHVNCRCCIKTTCEQHARIKVEDSLYVFSQDMWQVMIGL